MLEEISSSLVRRMCPCVDNSAGARWLPGGPFQGGAVVDGSVWSGFPGADTVHTAKLLGCGGHVQAGDAFGEAAGDV